MLVPTLFSSSMMVARLVLWLAGDSGPGLTGSWWHWSWGECGNKLEREREAATAPHSCNYFQRIKVCSDQQRTRNQSVSQSIISIFMSIRLPDLIVVVRSRYILAWQQGDKQIRCICIWRVEYPSHPLTLPRNIAVIVYIRTYVNWSPVNKELLLGEASLPPEETLIILALDQRTFEDYTGQTIWQTDFKNIQENVKFKIFPMTFLNF